MPENMLYHDIMDVMAADECPICNLMDARIKASMKNMLYESVLDIDMRHRLALSRGFCPRHGFMMRTLSDPLGHSIIYGALLDQAMSEMEEKPKLTEKYISHSDCVYCAEDKKNEEQTVSGFINGMGRNEFIDHYKETGPLCLHHFFMVRDLMAKQKAPNLRLLTMVTKEKYQTLSDELASFRRHADYRFADEPLPPRAADAWKRAVGTVTSADKEIKRKTE